MTGLDVSHPMRRARAGPPRLRLPASRQGMAWLAVLLIVGTLLAVQFGPADLRELGDRPARGGRCEAEIAEVEAENALLQQELDYLRSDAYVSAEARRLANLGCPASSC